LRWVAEDGGAAAGAWVGGSEGWAVDAILAFPFDGEGGIDFLQMDWFGISVPPVLQRSTASVFRSDREPPLMRYFFTLYLFPGFSRQKYKSNSGASTVTGHGTLGTQPLPRTPVKGNNSRNFQPLEWRFEPVHINFQTLDFGIEGARRQP